jgi:hypothetical protein
VRLAVSIFIVFRSGGGAASFARRSGAVSLGRGHRARESIVPLLIIEARIEFGPREVRVFRRVVVSACMTAKYCYEFFELEGKFCGEKGDFGRVTILDVRAGEADDSDGPAA